VCSWQGHAHWVDAVAVAAAGRRLVSGSSDGTVRVWSLERTECLAVFDTQNSVGGLLVHAGHVYATCGRRLLSFPLPA
jgi:WD40 repeat protein